MTAPNFLSVVKVAISVLSWVVCIVAVPITYKDIGSHNQMSMSVILLYVDQRVME